MGICNSKSSATANTGNIDNNPIVQLSNQSIENNTTKELFIPTNKVQSVSAATGAAVSTANNTNKAVYLTPNINTNTTNNNPNIVSATVSPAGSTINNSSRIQLLQSNNNTAISEYRSIQSSPIPNVNTLIVNNNNNNQSSASASASAAAPVPASADNIDSVSVPGTVLIEQLRVDIPSRLFNSRTGNTAEPDTGNSSIATYSTILQRIEPKTKSPLAAESSTEIDSSIADTRDRTVSEPVTATSTATATTTVSTIDKQSTTVTVESVPTAATVVESYQPKLIADSITTNPTNDTPAAAAATADATVVAVAADIPAESPQSQQEQDQGDESHQAVPESSTSEVEAETDNPSPKSQPPAAAAVTTTEPIIRNKVLKPSASAAVAESNNNNPSSVILHPKPRTMKSRSILATQRSETGDVIDPIQQLIESANLTDRTVFALMAATSRSVSPQSNMPGLEQTPPAAAVAINPVIVPTPVEIAT